VRIDQLAPLGRVFFLKQTLSRNFGERGIGIDSRDPPHDFFASIMACNASGELRPIDFKSSLSRMFKIWSVGDAWPFGGNSKTS